MKSLLIVDDDKIFCQVLLENFSKRGFEVQAAHNVAEALAQAEEFNPEWVLVDLNMPGLSGLELIPRLKEIDPGTRIVVLTGYASPATAVEAIKLGALHYLAKPVGMDEIIAAFDKESGDPKVPVAEILTLNDLEREHIASVMARNNQNISAAARELGLHRRTLQRKLDKLIR